MFFEYILEMIEFIIDSIGININFSELSFFALNLFFINFIELVEKIKNFIILLFQNGNFYFEWQLNIILIFLELF